VTAPACWVFTLPVFAHRGPIQDALDTTAEPGRGLGLCAPNRLDRLHDEADIDRADREFAENRIGISFKRCRPLLGMIGVRPAGTMRRHITFGALLERHDRSLAQTGREFCGPALLKRIGACVNLAAGVVGELTCLSKSDIAKAAEAHLTGALVDLVSEDP